MNPEKILNDTTADFELTKSRLVVRPKLSASRTCGVATVESTAELDLIVFS